MAEITAKMVKELREATGAGMMECKKALTEAEGDFEKAVDVLRTHGLAKAAKKAGRATNEGRVNVAVCKNDARKGAVVEVNCETDFVALTDKFQDYCDTFTRAVVHNNPATVDELLESEYEGEKVGDALTEAIHIIGENMQISNFKRLEIDGTGALVPYIHMNGRIGVLVGFTFDNEATATDERFLAMGKDVAMQIAATNPVSLDKESVPADIREHEFEIYKAQAAESGKPENIQEKIATGRMEKFYKENCLVEQEFVKDPDITVGAYIAKCAKEIGDDIKVVSFARIELGE
ncbi:MAG TPA: translation elongation factor Ts [Coriobacteriaceae bacterium]|nr:translation elongation factor Ts [Coriobacteriaceae bacterium]